MRKFALIALVAGFAFNANAQEAAEAAKAEEAVAVKAEVAKVSEADCKAAIDNMFKIEFAKDEANKDKMDELMAAAKADAGYAEAIAMCVKEFTAENAKCVIDAKTAEDIEKCDK